jgi:hypothetical protein
MGKIKYNNEDKYKGHFNDGRPSKHGELKYHLSIEGPNMELEGGEYYGEFKSGKRHGRGIMKWDDGSELDGEWSADERISGAMRLTNGFVIFLN